MAKSSKPTTRQVAAWLYNVVGPIVAGLARETHFLVLQKSPTWRFRLKQCEFIHRVASYVDAGQHPTLAQFLRFNPKLVKRVEAHDQGVVELEAAAEALHRALVEHPKVGTLAATLNQKFNGWRGAIQEEDSVNLLAEQIINLAHVREVPSAYYISPAWKEFGPEAIGLRSEPSVIPKAEGLEKALASLTERVDDLRHSLSVTRDRLADRHGLPPVPADSAQVAPFLET